MKTLSKAERGYMKSLRAAVLSSITETKEPDGIEVGRVAGIVAYTLLRMSAEFHLGLVGGEEFFQRSAAKVFADAKADFEAGIARAMKSK